jgi:hypothetical protein
MGCKYTLLAWYLFAVRLLPNLNCDCLRIRCHGAQDSGNNFGMATARSFHKMRVSSTESHCMMPIIR